MEERWQTGRRKGKVSLRLPEDSVTQRKGFSMRQAWGGTLSQPGKGSPDWRLALPNPSRKPSLNPIPALAGPGETGIGGRWFYIASLGSGNPESSSPSCALLELGSQSIHLSQEDLGAYRLGVRAWAGKQMHPWQLCP